MYSRTYKILFLGCLLCSLLQSRTFASGVDLRLDSLGDRLMRFIELGDEEKADAALADLKEDHTPGNQALVNYWEGRYLLEMGEKEMGVAQLKRTEEKAIAMGDTIVWARTLMYLAESQERRFDKDWRREQLRLAIDLLNAVGDSIGLIKGHYDLGTSYCKEGLSDSCEHHLSLAQTFSFYSESWVKLGTVLNYRGINFFNRGKYEEAIPYCLGSLKIYEEENEFSDIARTLNLLGSILHRMGDAEQSTAYYRKGLAVAVENGLETSEANILGNLGVVLQESGDKEEPLKHYQRSLTLHRRLGHKVGESAMLTNIALIYEQKKEFALAVQYQKEALAIDELIGDPFGEAISNFNLGDFYRQMELPDIALEYLETSESLAMKLDFQSMFPEVYDRYAKVYKAKEDFEKALYYTEKLDSINALINVPLEKDSARAEVFAYEVEKKKEELAEVRDAASNYQAILWGAGILVLGLLGFGLWMVLRQKKSRAIVGDLEEDRASLHQENQTLTENIVNLSQDLEAKEGLISKLQTQTEGSNGSLFEILERKVKQNHLWPGYMAEFEILYPGFVDRLVKANPELSPNDIRLLTLVKLNLNTAEIAEFLNITPGGVKKGRQRVRKKLDISSEQNLGQYLNLI